MLRALALAAVLFATAPRPERTVTPGAAGPNRLDVDVALLANAQPDLRDLRLIDAQDREVGYMLVMPQRNDTRWAEGRVLPVKETKKTSGFELDLGKALLVDRLRVDVTQSPFLKRATVEGSGDRARWTLLAEATVFDLPEEELRLHEIPFEGGLYRYLRVTWDDRSSARVSIDGASARERLAPAPQAQLTIDVRFTKRPSEPGKSRYRLLLPGLHLPLTALRIVVPSGNILRNALVTEPRLGNGQVTPLAVGAARLKQQQVGDLVASETKIGIAAPHGRELDLVIDDGNNPPLNIARIVAELAPQPWIYFESPDGAPLRLRYGDERAKAPSYDIEALRERVREQRTATAKLEEVGGIVTGVVQEPMKIPLGASVERSQFRTTRRIAEAPAGLALLVLDADVLARSSDLSDVRIADPEGRQVPYIIERRAEPLSLKLTIPERRAEQSRSIYAIDLPYDRWPEGTRLVLTTASRVFDRAVTLRRTADSHRNREAAILETAAWSSADPELLPPPLSFHVPSGVGAIELVIDEGDNAPLPIASAQLVLPSSALRFYHPGTTLSLLYGNRRASAPRYDLALLAPRLFGMPARELTLGAIDSREEDDDTPQRKVFWIAIAVAAVVLLVMLARLLR